MKIYYRQQIGGISMATQVDISVRQMMDNDIDRVLDIEEMSYTNPWNIDILTDLFFNENVCSKVVTMNNKVEGYNFYCVYDKYFQIMNLTISPRKRRKKLATHLIGDIFRTDDINIHTRNIDAWVNESKIPMLQLLKKNEFKAIGIAKELFGDDDGILMRFSITYDYTIPLEYKEMLNEFEYIPLKAS